MQFLRWFCRQCTSGERASLMQNARVHVGEYVADGLLDILRHASNNIIATILAQAKRRCRRWRRLSDCKRDDVSHRAQHLRQSSHRRLYFWKARNGERTDLGIGTRFIRETNAKQPWKTSEPAIHLPPALARALRYAFMRRVYSSVGRLVCLH